MTATEDDQVPSVPTISREELKERLDSGEDLVLLEALPEEEFEDYHLPGARNLPVDDVRDRAPETIPDRETDVVVYCANEDCPASPRATRILMDMDTRASATTRGQGGLAGSRSPRRGGRRGARAERLSVGPGSGGRARPGLRRTRPVSGGAIGRGRRSGHPPGAPSSSLSGYTSPSPTPMGGRVRARGAGLWASRTGAKTL